MSEKRYGIAPNAIKSPLSLEQQNEIHGEALWERDPSRCCRIRKVHPHAKFRAGYDAGSPAFAAIELRRARQRPSYSPTNNSALQRSTTGPWREKRIRRYADEHEAP